jgi:hypothetical protein
MRKLSTSLSLCFLLLALSGCDQPSLIILEVRGSYEVPGEINALEIIVVEPDEMEELARIPLNLTDEHQLPIEVSLEPSEETPTALETEVRASLDGVPVAASKAIHDWQSGKISRVKMPELEAL